MRWGVVTEEAQLRTWPTYDVSYDLQDDVNFDLNCETVLKTGERVAVLHVSTDEEWLLVQAYNYLGWLPLRRSLSPAGTTGFRLEIPKTGW